MIGFSSAAFTLLESPAIDGRNLEKNVYSLLSRVKAPSFLTGFTL
jgi:hypothetical protein